MTTAVDSTSMGPTMDEQTMRTIITILRQQLAEVEWQNVQLQAEIIRLTQTPGSPE
jgi:hypothetical protein